ncbi:4-hydroxybenzoate-octaprenyltransferase [Legionella feeleii]|uniref:4-hydroxybenzoate octaprenyltransferase n=2 Tax=Legionella feeleii TaxID=453 RepID=A0A378ITJ3_9GAMM|nr:4-hydroxybenzoate-octaprenyltransferase [Legionella feeleii]
MKGSYLRLMRFHKPVGILLLWLPTAWALWIVNQGYPSLELIVLFLCGTVLMRAAGCVINDIADRHIDLHVERTQRRPLTSGEVSLIEAFVLLFILLFAALMILLQLPKQCFYYALFAVFITFLYPFCKRFIQGPQLVLGVAFSMGIPMAYAASGKVPDSMMFYLLIINFMWIVAYDSQYAMVDREDDLRIGVKSTAILFADYDRIIIGILQIVFHGLWLFLAIRLNNFWPFFYCWLLAAFLLGYQQKLIAQRQPAQCLQAFSSNNWYGTLMWLAIILNYLW